MHDSSNQTTPNKWAPPPAVERRLPYMPPPPIPDALRGPQPPLVWNDGTPFSTEDAPSWAPPPSPLVPPPALPQPKGLLTQLKERLGGMMPGPGASGAGGALGPLGAIAGIVLGSPNREDPGTMLKDAAAGVVQGSALIPDRFAPKVDTPDELVRAIVAVPTAIGEAVATDKGVLSTLGWMHRQGGKLGAVAGRALRAFGQGKDLGIGQQIVGSTMLGVASEAGLQATRVGYGEQGIDEMMNAMRAPAVVAGAAVGIRNAPRVITAGSKLVPPKLQERLTQLGELITYEPKLVKLPGTKTHLDPTYTAADDVIAHESQRRNAYARAIDRVSEVLAPLRERTHHGITGLHKEANYAYFREMVEKWTKLQVLEAKGEVGGAEYSALVDELKQLRVGLKEPNLPPPGTMGPIGPEFVPQTRGRHIGKNASVISRAFDAYTKMITEAMTQHSDVIPDMSLLPWQIANGKIPKHSDDFDDFIAKRLGKFYQTALDRNHTFDMIDTNGIDVRTLPVELQKRLQAGHTVDLGGKQHRLLTTWTLPKTIAQMVEQKPQEFTNFAVPVEVGTHLSKWGYAKGADGLLGDINAKTNAWKGAVLFWGGPALQTMQTIGDTYAMVRSFPGLVFDPRNWGAFAKAARLQAEKYRLATWKKGDGIDETLWKNDNLIYGAARGTATALTAGALAGEDDPEMMGVYALTGLVGGTASQLARHIGRTRRFRESYGEIGKHKPGPWDLAAHNEYHKLADKGLIDSGFYGRENDSLGRSLAQRVYGPVAGDTSVARKTWDSFMSVVTGQVRPGAFTAVADRIDGITTLMRERENFMRLAAYYHQVSKGVDEAIAVKRASEAFVDYRRFSEFENKFVRGFMLPFYSFYRHSIPNWGKAMFGRDVAADTMTRIKPHFSTDEVVQLSKNLQLPLHVVQEAATMHPRQAQALFTKLSDEYDQMVKQGVPVGQMGDNDALRGLYMNVAQRPAEEIGGMGGKAALGATMGLLGFEAVAQLWNEQFEEERTLDPNVRKDFHIIFGLPERFGGEGAYRDDKGRPIVLGFTTPPEQLFELLGLEGMGAITSAMFGSGIPEDDSLFARARRIEEWDAASEVVKAPFRGASQRIKSLLNPVAALGIEAFTGENLAFGSPIVSEYSDDPAWLQWLDHAGKRILPLYNAGNGLYRETHAEYDRDGKRVFTDWNFYTSRIGLGLPVDAIDQNRALKYRLGDMLELAERDGKGFSPEERAITDLIYQRADPEMPTPDETKEVMKMVQESANPEDAAYLMRFYGRQSARRSRLQKQWDAMNVRQRATFLQDAPAEDIAALVVFLNGGRVFPDPSAVEVGAQ